MINRYKLKDGITIQDIETEIKQRLREDKSFHGMFGKGGTWINDKTHVDTHFISCQCGNQDISLNIGFPGDLSQWNDFEDVLILDEDFGQPYGPFYNVMDDKTKAFPFVLNIIGNYNKLMNSFSFLEKKE